MDPEKVDAHGGVQAGQTNTWMAQNSAGSGPYKVDEWKDNGNRVCLKRNSHYHKGWGGNHFDKIEFKYVENELERLDAIQDR